MVEPARAEVASTEPIGTYFSTSVEVIPQHPSSEKTNPEPGRGSGSEPNGGAGEDWDYDGLTNLWEYQNGTNPQVNDAFQDPDEDGFCNVREFGGNSDPNDAGNTPPATLFIYVDVGATRSENASSTNPFNTNESPRSLLRGDSFVQQKGWGP